MFSDLAWSQFCPGTCGRPYRILFAFDPRRSAYLMLAGDKTGDDRWYDTAAPKADEIYAKHLAQIGYSPSGRESRE